MIEVLFKKYSPRYFKEVIELIKFYNRDRIFEKKGPEKFNQVIDGKLKREKIKNLGIFDKKEYEETKNLLKKTDFLRIISYVVLNKEKIIGIGIGIIKADSFEPKFVYIYPEFTHKNIGKNLFLLLFKEAKKINPKIKKVEFWSGERFYYSHNFFKKYFGKGKKVKFKTKVGNNFYKSYKLKFNYPINNVIKNLSI